MNLWKQGLKKFIKNLFLLILGCWSSFFTQKLKSTF